MRYKQAPCFYIIITVIIIVIIIAIIIINEVAPERTPEFSLHSSHLCIIGTICKAPLKHLDMFYYHSNDTFFSRSSSEKRENFEPVNQQNKLPNRKQHQPVQHNPVNWLVNARDGENLPQSDVGSLKGHKPVFSHAMSHPQSRRRNPCTSIARFWGFLRILQLTTVLHPQK